MKFKTTQLSIFNSQNFINEIVSWAFDEDGTYVPFKHKIGMYFAVLHYFAEDVDFDNLGVEELYDLIYTDDNADEIERFVYGNPQTRDLVSVARDTINARFDIDKRKTDIYKAINKLVEYLDKNPEIFLSATAPQVVTSNGEKEET